MDSTRSWSAHCGRGSHPTHFNLDEAVEVAQRIAPRRTLLTHISHDLDHEQTCLSLPEGIDLAYDGLQVSISTD